MVRRRGREPPRERVQRRRPAHQHLAAPRLRDAAMLQPRGAYVTDARDALMVTLERAYRSWTPETVSTVVGHAVVTHTVFPVKCSTPRQPRWIAAARAVPASVPAASRAERTLVLSSVFEIVGKPIIAMMPMRTTTMTISMVVKPERRMAMPPVRRLSLSRLVPRRKSLYCCMLCNWTGARLYCKKLHKCRVLH